MTDGNVDRLIDHIISVHHEFLRREVPRLIEVAGQVATQHGARYPQLMGVHNELEEFWADLNSHLREEEEVLFPSLREGLHAIAGESFLIAIEGEHLKTSASLGRIRALTDNYAAPGSACDLQQSLFIGLARVEADLRIHIHEENNILIPWARSLATGTENRNGTKNENVPTPGSR